MEGFRGSSPLLFIFLLYLAPAQQTPSTEEATPRVMSLSEVFEKSSCQPMKQFVDVWREFPEEVEHIFLPPCVPLQRCSGCCQDEKLECQPTLKSNVTVEMIRLTLGSHSQVNLTFVEHQECECRLPSEP